MVLEAGAAFERAEDGGAEPFHEVYDRHAAAVFRFALRCVGRRDLAEDLTSEAFLALHQNVGNVDIAQLSDADPLLADCPGAVFMVRVTAAQIFPNCPRYIHKMQLV